MIYQLVLMSPSDTWARIWTRYPIEEDAEESAARWALKRPDEIVMLVPLETGVCKHCDAPIEESLGWVLHRWVHSNFKTYTCWNVELTQAEPKEVLSERGLA